MDKKKILVHFIGAGPGDPDLITVKGMKLLKKADVAVYTGSLVNGRILKYCKKGVEAHDSASMHLDEITGIMVKSARENKRVVRLHTGDPSLYGALREQTDRLEAAGVPYEVVPGVSSAFAAAAALKRELTSPGVTQTVIFTRLEGRTPVPEAENLKGLATHGATVCVFLSASMIEKVVRELLSGGCPEDTPAAVVYKATWEDELAIKGTLKDIAGKTREAGITRHAIIIVGRAIGEDIAKEASRLYDRDFRHGFRG